MYNLNLTALYPDGTVITNFRTKTNVLTAAVDHKNVTFGAPLFGKLEAIRSFNRIDILQTKVIFSVHPELGDICYNYGVVKQFLYGNGAVISQSFSQRFFNNINTLVSVTHDGVSFFNQFSNQVFQGPQLLCISTYYSRAFVTTVASLAEDIWGHYYYIGLNFTEPVLAVANESVVISSRHELGIIEIGSNINAPPETYVSINVIVEDRGTPVATVTEWRRNDDVVETDIDKNQIVSPNGFSVILTRLLPIHVGIYTFTLSNTVGSATATSTVTYRPNGCKFHCNDFLMYVFHSNSWYYKSTS